VGVDLHELAPTPGILVGCSCSCIRGHGVSLLLFFDGVRRPILSHRFGAWRSQWYSPRRGSSVQCIPVVPVAPVTPLCSSLLRRVDGLREAHPRSSDTGQSISSSCRLGSRYSGLKETHSCCAWLLRRDHAHIVHLVNLSGLLPSSLVVAPVVSKRRTARGSSINWLVVMMAIVDLLLVAPEHLAPSCDSQVNCGGDTLTPVVCGQWSQRDALL
jgi:hypothetical protein